ncbi:MAG: right-handed parallel beta-helix repeat-containing protein [Methanobrevibacter sp.]|jgi:hypothetical protein|nr:right-handed parallel beta-helix repeat-containing protein [Candidatus Methanoflexus mossambicus]
MKIKKSIILFALILAIVAVGSSVSFAATIDVNNTMSNNDIQAKIDSAELGDTINFAPGEYSDIAFKLNKSITLNGNGAILKGSNSSSQAITLSAPSDITQYKDISIKNFVINSATGKYAIAQSGNLQGLMLDSLTITGTGNKADGIRTNSITDLTISNCIISSSRDAINIMGGSEYTIIGNTIHGDRNAISLAGDTNNYNITGNNIYDSQFGVYYGGGVNFVTITNNNFTNIVNGLAFIKAAQNTLVENNNFKDNKIAIEIKAGDTHHGAPTTATNITIINNNILNSSYYGVLLHQVYDKSIGSVINIENNNFCNNDGIDTNGWAIIDALGLSNMDNSQSFEWGSSATLFDLVKDYIAPSENGTSGNDTYENGYTAGFADGNASGYTSGLADGKSIGYNNGLADGKKVLKPAKIIYSTNTVTVGKTSTKTYTFVNAGEKTGSKTITFSFSKSLINKISKYSLPKGSSYKYNVKTQKVSLTVKNLVSAKFLKVSYTIKK